MLKKIIILLIAITTLHSRGMERPMDDKPMNVETGTTCHLAQLPTDVQDRIAQLLTFNDIETEEEFITRTQTMIMKKISDKYLLPRSNNRSCDVKDSTFWQHPQNTIGEFCPNQTYIALLNRTTLNVFNINKDPSVYTEVLPEGDTYLNITLSRGARMLAIIHEHRERDTAFSPNDPTLYFLSTRHLTIKDIISQKTETVTLPTHFEIPFASTFGFILPDKQYSAI